MSDDERVTKPFKFVTGQSKSNSPELEPHLPGSLRCTLIIEVMLWACLLTFVQPV